MRFPRRDDPTDSNDPDEVMITTTGIPRPLMWGLAKGVLMLAVVAGITWAAATALQDRAQDEGQTAQARDQAVQQPLTTVPADTGASPDGRPTDSQAAPTAVPPTR